MQKERALEELKLRLYEQIAEVEGELQAVLLEKGSLAPINILPDDVLVHVLEYLCLHHYPHCGAVANERLLHPAITISHVSRRWRSLALSLSNIWQCVHVTRNQPPQYHRIVKLYLTRSRNLPLSFHFVTLSTDCDDHGSGATWVRFRASQHWQRLWQSWLMLRAEAHQIGRAHV